MAATNLTTTAQFKVKAREIDFVSRFEKNWTALADILGIMRPIKKEPGTKLTSSIATVTLNDGDVGEGEEIPYSIASVQPVAYADLTLQKYRKGVTIEAVNKFGARVAVQKTDNAFLNQLQSKVMGDFYDFIKTGLIKSTETTFQMAVSMAIGRVKDKFNKMDMDGSRVVVWVNTLDVYRYLGAAEIGIQTAFGFSYVKNFLGADVVIISSKIPEGKVIATPVDNIVLYYIDPGDSQFKELGLDYTVTGVTNLIGFHASGDYAHALGDSFALMGMKLWAEYLDAIAVIDIGTPAEAVSLDKSDAELAIGDDLTLVATTTPASADVTWASDNTEVATVDDGVVTAVAEGVAHITATNGDAVATCTVTVKESNS